MCQTHNLHSYPLYVQAFRNAAPSSEHKLILNVVGGMVGLQLLHASLAVSTQSNGLSIEKSEVFFFVQMYSLSLYGSLFFASAIARCFSSFFLFCYVCFLGPCYPFGPNEPVLIGVSKYKHGSSAILDGVCIGRGASSRSTPNSVQFLAQVREQV